MGQIRLQSTGGSQRRRYVVRYSPDRLSCGIMDSEAQVAMGRLLTGLDACGGCEKGTGDSARLPSGDLRERLGRGIIQAQKALAVKPAKENELSKTDSDSVRFPFLRVITGLGVAAAPDARQRMLEMEALQIAQQSREIEEMFPDPDQEVTDLPEAKRQRIIDALASAPGVSKNLREALGSRARVVRRPISVPKQLTPAEKHDP